MTAPTSWRDLFWSLLPAALVGIGSVAATLLVTAATGWLQFRPSPASISLRPNSFEVHQAFPGEYAYVAAESSPGVRSIHIYSWLVYEKKGDKSSEDCRISLKDIESNRFGAKVYSGVIDSRNERVYENRFRIPEGEHQRVIEFTFWIEQKERQKLYPAYNNIEVTLICENVVSLPVSFPLAPQICNAFPFDKVGCAS